MENIQIRPIGAEEWAGYHSGVVQEAFNSNRPAQAIEDDKKGVEFDRTLVAFEGTLPVGGTIAASFTMTVPGGPQAVAGITSVAVLPSHRRGGVLTALMRRQLTDLHEGREAVAGLYASETPIYGRFGYGCASRVLNFRIPRGGNAFVRDAGNDPALRLRVATPADAQADMAKVYDTVVGTRPGMLARKAWWWQSMLADPEYRREGTGQRRCVIVEDGSGPRGYALFRAKPSWSDHGLPDGELILSDLHATDPAAYATVWRHVLDRDLVGTVRAGYRPVDDPLLYLLADPRQLHPCWTDELWVRLVDVDRALRMRAYAAPVDVVIDMTDYVCPWNARRWRLAADSTGASCEATGDAADLALPAWVLGAAYLGGHGLAGFVRAGLVREHTPGAVAALSAALSWDPQPWCGAIF